LERIELPEEVLEELKDSIKDAKKLVLTLVDSESFRNVVPMYLEEIGEVEGEESLRVVGTTNAFKAFPAGSKTLIVVKRGEVLELVIVDVEFEKMKRFLKGEEGYEVDESSFAPEEVEEEEEEYEPEVTQAS